MTETVESPCIRVCLMDEPTGFCLGCGRTLAEVSGWLRMSNDEKRAVVAQLPARLKAIEDE